MNRILATSLVAAFAFSADLSAQEVVSASIEPPETAVGIPRSLILELKNSSRDVVVVPRHFVMRARLGLSAEFDVQTETGSTLNVPFEYGLADLTIPPQGHRTLYIPIGRTLVSPGPFGDTRLHREGDWIATFLFDAALDGEFMRTLRDPSIIVRDIPFRVEQTQADKSLWTELMERTDGAGLAGLPTSDVRRVIVRMLLQAHPASSYHPDLMMLSGPNASCEEATALVAAVLSLNPRSYVHDRMLERQVSYCRMYAGGMFEDAEAKRRMEHVAALAFTFVSNARTDLGRRLARKQLEDVQAEIRRRFATE